MIEQSTQDNGASVPDHATHEQNPTVSALRVGIVSAADEWEVLAVGYQALSGKAYHMSDCATCCAPAYKPSACDCDAPDAEVWSDFDAAPKDKELLIVGGEFEDEDECFPTWRPFTGHALVNWTRDGWQGENRPSHDNWRWHRGFRWMLPPAKAMETRQGQDATQLGATHDSAVAESDLPNPSQDTLHGTP